MLKRPITVLRFGRTTVLLAASMSAGDPSTETPTLQVEHAG